MGPVSQKIHILCLLNVPLSKKHLIIAYFVSLGKETEGTIAIEERDLWNRREEENVSGFWQLWEQHKEGLFRKCLSIMNRDVDEAEDALSMAMLRARDKFSTHAAHIDNIKGWLYRLTENICIDLLRKRKIQESFSDRLEAGIANNKMYEFNFLESAEDKYQREEILKKVYEMVKQLPTRLREPAILRFFMKIPNRDIALLLNLTNENTRKRIQQARAILGRELKGVMGNSSLSLHLGEKKNGDSPTWMAIKEEAEIIINRRKLELKFTYTATQIVKVCHPSGVVRDIPIFLNRKPGREKTRAKTLQEYITRYPGGWRKHLELGEIFYAVGNWDQAVKELQIVVEKHPQSLDAWLLLGQMLMNMEPGKRAIEVYKKACSFVHNESSKYHLSGMMELCRKQVKAAVAAFTKAAAVEPWNEIHHQAMGLCLVQDDRPLEALQAFEAALTINPKDLVSLTHSYEPLVSTGRLEKAGQYVNRVLEIYPYDILALKRKVEQRCRLGLVKEENGEKTKRMIRQLKQLAPHIAAVQEAAAVYHFYRGKWDKTRELLKNAALAQDNAPGTWYLYSRWLYCTGDYQTAAEAILKALQLSKKDAAVMSAACEILSRASCPERPDLLKSLQSIIEDMLRYFPLCWHACSTAGLVLAAHFNEMERACALSRQAVELQPLLPAAYFNLGRVLTLAGKHSRAVESLEKGWQLLPEGDYCAHVVDGAWLLAQCCKALGDHSMAHHWLQRVISCSRQLKRYRPAEGFYMEGQALGALGDKQGCSSAFRSALWCNLPYPARQQVNRVLK